MTYEPYRRSAGGLIEQDQGGEGRMGFPLGGHFVLTVPFLATVLLYYVRIGFLQIYLVFFIF